MERDARKPLEPGTPLPINGGTYIIGDLVGRGGLSLVYQAAKEGGTTQSVIKEFYPAPDRYNHPYADRDADGRVHCIREECLRKFEAARKLFESEAIIGGRAADASSQVISFWEYDDGYAVMKRQSADICSLRTLVRHWEEECGLLSPSRKKWEDTHNMDIVRINYALAIIDSLLTAVSSIHEKYLHLDLSSTNVLWACSEPASGRNGFAIISDFGSAAPLDSYGKFRPDSNVFSSGGFAAPEIFRRDCILDRKTDLFSVGMLLIYLCVGEAVFRREFTCGCRQPWLLEGDIENIDLDIPRPFATRLNEVLLNALVKRIFETAQEMQKDIRKLRDATRLYIDDQEKAGISVGNKIRGALSDAEYVPRKEMADLADLLERNQNPIITGIGGIGKTTLARRFAVEYGGGQPYFVSFTSFAGSFRRTIAELGYDPSGEQWAKKEPDDQFITGLALLRSCSSNYVLIIDNADTRYDLRSDPDYHYLQEMPMHFIITSRNDLEGAEIVHLDRMGEEDCLTLMKNYLPGEYRNGTHDAVLKAIIAKIDGHTLTCELLAKTLRESFKLTPESVLASLKESKLSEERWHKVQSTYNLENIPQTVLAHIQTAFNVSELSDEIKRILGCFCLAEYGLTREYVELLFSADEWESILEAEKRGWLICRNENGELEYSSRTVYLLHPVIRAICLLDTTVAPSWQKNKSFIRKYIGEFTLHKKTDYLWDINHNKYGVFFVQALKMDDFNMIEEEEPGLASMIYIEMITIADETPYLLDASIADVFSLTGIDIQEVGFQFATIAYLSKEQKSALLTKCEEYLIYYARKAIEFVRQDDRLFKSLLLTLKTVSLGHGWKHLEFELSRAILYCELTTMPRPIQDSPQEELDRAAEAYYSTAVSYHNEILGMGKDKSSSELLHYFARYILFGLFSSDILQYWFALFHLQRHDEAIQLLDVYIREIEELPLISAWVVTSACDCFEDESRRKVAEFRQYIIFVSDRKQMAEKQLESSAYNDWLGELVKFCELQYWAAIASGQEALASTYKRKYVHYISLLSCIHEADPLYYFLAKWEKWFASHPFTPPVIDGTIFDKGQDLPPCARYV